MHTKRELTLFGQSEILGRPLFTRVKSRPRRIDWPKGACVAWVSARARGGAAVDDMDVDADEMSADEQEYEKLDPELYDL